MKVIYAEKGHGIHSRIIMHGTRLAFVGIWQVNWYVLLRNFTATDKIYEITDMHLWYDYNETLVLHSMLAYYTLPLRTKLYFRIRYWLTKDYIWISRSD